MAFQQGLSGLNATSKNLEIIGNNIANANTFGYKMSRAEFSDMYAAALNGAGSNTVGIGTRLASVAQQFTQGNIVVTENSLDLAINGAGFFQLGPPDGTPPVFTRNGQFRVDKEGYIVNAQGLRLLGAGQTPLQVQSGALIEPRSTTDPSAGPISIELNLNAADNKTYSGPFNASNPDTYSNATSITVYDEAGTPKALTLYFRRAATPNQWLLYAELDGTTVNPSPASTLTFNTAGVLTAPPGGQVTLLNLFGTGSPNATLEFDATQYAAAFAVTDMKQGGYAAGTPTSMVIEPDGKLMVRYSNGRSIQGGQVELVNFRNPQGLQPLGNNVWANTFASGEPSSRGGPGSGSLGLIQAGALEESNVDLTAELVNMITAQRMYQANAQTIKTTDQAMQSLLNLR